MSDENTKRPVKCADCGWTGHDDKGMKALRYCDALGERLDPGCVVPAGECDECGAFVYFTDQKSREQWRNLADDAVTMLDELHNGTFSDSDWREVDDILETHANWTNIEATS